MKRIKNIKVIAVAVVLVCVVVACIALASCRSMGGVADREPAMGFDNEAYGKEEGALGGAVGSDNGIADADRKIIKTVNESVQTEDYDGFVEAVRERTATLGGYITSANYRGDSYYGQNNLRQATLTLRIPAARLGEFTDSVSTLGVVTGYTESAKDVTSAYVDTESRIAVLAAEEAALLGILSEAQTVSDALEIRTRLSAVQSDLASLRAQKNSYDTLTEYSTVHLTVYEVRRAESTDPTFLEEISYNFSDSIDSIGAGLRAFAVWLIGDIIYILLVSGLLVGGFFGARCVIRRRRARLNEEKPNSEMPESEKPNSEMPEDGSADE